MRFVLVAFSLLVFGVAVVSCGGATDSGANNGGTTLTVGLRSDFEGRTGDVIPVMAQVDGAKATDVAWDVKQSPQGATPTLDTQADGSLHFSADQAGDYIIEATVTNGSKVASDDLTIMLSNDYEFPAWQGHSASPYLVPEVVDIGTNGTTQNVAVFGDYIVEGGDIVVGKLSQVQTVGSEGLARADAAFPTRVIPYAFDTGDFTSGEQATIREHLRSLASETVLTFEDVTGNTNFTQMKLLFKRNATLGQLSGCWAEKNPVIYPNNRVVNLGTTPGECMDRHTVKHEVLHAVGFFHEQQRPDRDNYVSVKITENILVHPIAYKEAKGNYTLNFAIPPNPVMYGPYDWRSILHYELGAYKGVDMEVQPGVTVPPGVFVGDPNQTDLSDGDVAAVKALYGESVTNNTPTITNFQAIPSTVIAGRPTTFSWAIDFPGGALTCTIDPGDGSTLLTVNDCGTTTDQTYTYISASGSPYTAILTIQGAAVSKTTTVTVSGSSGGPPLSGNFQGTLSSNESAKYEDAFDLSTDYSGSLKSAANTFALAATTGPTPTVTAAEAFQGSVVSITSGGSHLLSGYLGITAQTGTVVFTNMPSHLTHCQPSGQPFSTLCIDNSAPSGGYLYAFVYATGPVDFTLNGGAYTLSTGWNLYGITITANGPSLVAQPLSNFSSEAHFIPYTQSSVHGAASVKGARQWNLLFGQ